MDEQGWSDYPSEGEKQMTPVQQTTVAPPRAIAAPAVPIVAPVPTAPKSQSNAGRDEQDADRRRSAAVPALYGPGGRRDARAPGSTISIIA